MVAGPNCERLSCCCYFQWKWKSYTVRILWVNNNQFTTRILKSFFFIVNFVEKKKSDIKMTSFGIFRRFRSMKHNISYFIELWNRFLIRFIISYPKLKTDETLIVCDENKNRWMNFASPFSFLMKFQQLKSNNIHQYLSFIYSFLFIILFCSRASYPLVQSMGFTIFLEEKKL